MSEPQIASPLPKLKKGYAVTTTDRYVAAQQLRTILHKQLAAGQIVTGSRLTKATRLTLNSQLQQLRGEAQLMLSALLQLDESVKERKVRPSQEQITNLRLALHRIEAVVLHQQVKLDGITTSSTGPSDWYSLVKQLYDLAQCLPTVADIPQTPAENTLRAIVALLRAHHFEGLEGVTQVVKKEVSDVKAQLEQVAAAVGQPVASGPAPGFGDEGDDGEDDDPDSYDE